MISDCQLLGIEETTDIQKIKSAYRKKVKEVHPDNSSEEDRFKNHLLFIQINQAYSRLMGEFKGQNEKNRNVVKPTIGKAIVEHKDPAYVFYRTGMQFFMKIHPSQWSHHKDLFQKSSVAIDEKAQEENRQIVLELIKLFPRAYYYFSIVIHEYPNSPWANDALEKMKLIEDRTKKYLKIIESFKAWPSVPKEKANRLEKTIERTNKIIKGQERPLTWLE